MARRFVCAAVLTLVTCGVALADEFTAIITKVEGNKVTYHPAKFDPDTKKFEKSGVARPLEAAANVKVVKGGKYNKDSRKFENTEAVEGGLKGPLLTKIPSEGVTVIMYTEGGKITEIYIRTAKKK
jgi:hypothetical protein